MPFSKAFSKVLNVRSSKNDYSGIEHRIPSRSTSKKDYQAERYFRAIKQVNSEADRALYLERFEQRWPGYILEPFYTTGFYKTRKAYDLLRGQNTKHVFASCGSMGRLRVLAGGPLDRTIISFGALPKVRAFINDPDAQFSQQIMDWVGEDLTQFFVKGSFIAFVERGKNSENHTHVFSRRGACKIGTTKSVPDNELLEAVKYVVKKPYWTKENALAYLRSANLSKQVGRRIIKHGLGDSRTRKITVYEVEQILGIELIKVDKPTRFLNLDNILENVIRFSFSKL